MNEQERRQIVEAALGALAGAAASDAFLILAVEGQPHNYVQMVPDGYTEATLRQYAGLIPLTGEEKARLRGKGFEDSGAGNAYRFFDGCQDAALPGVVEWIFREVYGAAADFDYEVDLHVEDSDLDKRALAAAWPAPYDGLVAGWLGIDL